MKGKRGNTSWKRKKTPWHITNSTMYRKSGCPIERWVHGVDQGSLVR